MENRILTEEQKEIADKLTEKMVRDGQNVLIRAEVLYDPNDGKIKIEVGSNRVIFEFFKRTLKDEFEKWYEETALNVHNLLAESLDELTGNVPKADKSPRIEKIVNISDKQQ